MTTSLVLYRTMAASCLLLLVSCGGSDGADPDVSGAGGRDATGGRPGTSTGGVDGTSATGAAGTSTSASGGTGGQGTGGQGTGGSSGAVLSATWTFPSLITTTKVAATFPTYVAHLLGKQITEPFPTDFACASVANSGISAGTAHLSVSLGAYGSAVNTDLNVPPRSSKKACVTPNFDKAALYALTAPDNATLTATAQDASGADIGSSNMTIAIAPADDIPWSANGITPTTLREMSAVYVEPNALEIDKLQRLALQYSAFGIWDSGNGPYLRNPYLRSDAIPSGHFVYDPFVVEPAEAAQSFVWTIQSVTCSPCTNEAVDVAIFTADQLSAYLAGTSNTATAVWLSQGTGRSGSQVLGTAGQYYIAFINAGSNVGDRSVAWTRTVTKEDVVRDVLLATFQALRAANLTYSDITSTFFSEWQHVRRVTESLEAASANCIDGSFVFASVAELLGVQPVLIFKTGHAYMGIRSGPGSSVIWPIETTLVGSTTVTPLDAYATAITNRAMDKATDPNYQEIDIATMRGRGVTPLVQQ